MTRRVRSNDTVFWIFFSFSVLIDFVAIYFLFRPTQNLWPPAVCNVDYNLIQFLIKSSLVWMQ